MAASDCDHGVRGLGGNFDIRTRHRSDYRPLCCGYRNWGGRAPGQAGAMETGIRAKRQSPHSDDLSRGLKMAALRIQPDLKITGIMNPGRGCGVQKAERNFSVGWHVKKCLRRYGERILGSFPPRIRMPAIDYGAWIYTLRAACASCLALYISFSLNLDAAPQGGARYPVTTQILRVSRRSASLGFTSPDGWLCTRMKE